MKFYCVTSSFDGRGHATAAITNVVVAQKKPKSTCNSTFSKDIYNDYFASREAAEQFVRDVFEA